MLWSSVVLAVAPPETTTKTFPAWDTLTFKVPESAMAPKDVSGYPDKLDGRLWQLVVEARTRKSPDVQAKAWTLGVPYEDGRVAVTLLAEQGVSLDSLKNEVIQRDGRVTATLGNAVFARMPIDKVLPLSEQRSLYYMAPQEMSYPMAMDIPTQKALADGVRLVGVERLHQAGIKGKGIKVGILDFGFARYGELMQAGLVPNPKAQRAFNQRQVLENGNVHGTACAEIIHAMAPEAELYLAAVDGSLDEVIQAAQWLADQGVHIISYSGGTHAAPQDGRALLDRLVDQIVTEKKILWVTSSGNEGQSHWSGLLQDQDRNQLVDIVPGRDCVLMQTAGSELLVVVVWDDWGPDPDHPSASQDIDAILGVVNRATRQIEWLAQSRNPQNGRGIPVEAIRIPAQPDKFYVLVLPAQQIRQPVKVHVFVKDTRLEPFVSESSVGTPGTARQALTVGAVDVNSDELASYSSWGPTSDGRVKPEVSAPAGTQSAAYSERGGKFFGTSASCPHVSGYAALLKQINPDIPVADLRAAVVRYVQPKGSPVPNNQYGYGRIAASTIQLGREGQPAPGQPELLKPIMDILERSAPPSSSGSGRPAESPGGGTTPPRKLEEMLR